MEIAVCPTPVCSSVQITFDLSIIQPCMLCGRVAAYAFLVTTRHPRLLGHASAQAATQQLLHHPHFHTGRLEARRAVIMAAADNDVRVALRKLLPTVDMDTTSERKASHQLTPRLHKCRPIQLLAGTAACVTASIMQLSFLGPTGVSACVAAAGSCADSWTAS